MAGQRDRARAASKFGAPAVTLEDGCETEFLGYDGTEASCEDRRAFQGRQASRSLADGDEGAVVLSSTPFYARVGGQIGDTGILVDDGKLFTCRRYAEERQGQCALRHGRAGRAQGRRQRRGCRRCGSSPGNSAESFGDASDARGLAAGAWRSRARKRARWSRRIACASTSRTTKA